ncbi:MAG: pyridoxamine 5'-phosphate oxidase family protein [Raoultibacter sp.]|jgi:uncharacterized pyridoxamine 5'-phosphate oxidase family protein
MDEVLAYLKKNPTYFLATDNQGKPEVRPFGTITKFENKLYIQTGKSKKVYEQMIANPYVAISAADSDGTWLRINARVTPDESIDAQQAVLDEYPELAPMYTAGDGNTIVFSLSEVQASFSSFTAPERTLSF